MKEKWVPDFSSSHSCGLELATAVVEASLGQKSMWEVSLVTEVSFITYSPLAMLPPLCPWDFQSPLYLVLCKDKLQLHGPLGPWHRDERTVAL